MKHPGLFPLVCIILLACPCMAGEGDGIQVDADISGVSIFVDNAYVGDTPVTIPGLEAGEYCIAATAPGYPAQKKNITLSFQESQNIFFSFGTNPSFHEPGMIRIQDCIGTPEMTGMSGTSVSIVTLPGGDLMAYYSGQGDSVRCAGSVDGTRWHEYPDGCMEDSGSFLLQLSRPWVFPARDGGYRMIYLSGDPSDPSLTLAFSVDGKRFIPEGEVKLSYLSEPDSFLPPTRYIPTGVRLKDGNIRMYYSPQTGGIRSAISTDDGKTWMEEEGYRLESATDPAAVILPDGRTGLFYVDLSAGSKGQKLMVAPSADGITFAPEESEVVIESDQKGVWILDPDVHISADGNWDLFFSLMGTPGGAGITVPPVMKTVVDPDCLMARFSQNSS